VLPACHRCGRATTYPIPCYHKQTPRHRGDNPQAQISRLAWTKYRARRKALQVARKWVLQVQWPTRRNPETTARTNRHFRYHAPAESPACAHIPSGTARKSPRNPARPKHRPEREFPGKMWSPTTSRKLISGGQTGLDQPSCTISTRLTPWLAGAPLGLLGSPSGSIIAQSIFRVIRYLGRLNQSISRRRTAKRGLHHALE